MQRAAEVHEKANRGLGPTRTALGFHRETLRRQARTARACYHRPDSAIWPRGDTTSEITPELREFVATKFGSPEQIDVFLLLHRHAERDWTVGDVAAELGMPPPSAGMRLFLLASAGLLSASAGTEASYRYTGEATLDLLAGMLAGADPAARAELAAMVSGAPRPDPARQFADAFRLRKP